MSMRLGRLASVVLLVAASTVFVGCPLRIGFNASGNYQGTMWTPSDNQCVMKMTLFHAPELPYPLGYQVVGFVTFDPICILDMPALNEFLADVPEVTIPVYGSFSEGVAGELTLTIDTESIQVELPFGVNFTCTGIGADTDEDTAMDTYTGTYSLTVEIETGIQGYEVVTIDFTDAFEVFAVD